MTVRTPSEAADWVRAFIADLPGKIMRSLIAAFSQTGNLLALAFMFIIGVVAQPIAGPYLARYGLPVKVALAEPQPKPDAVLGQIQRLYALTGDALQGIDSIRKDTDVLKALIRPPNQATATAEPPKRRVSKPAQPMPPPTPQQPDTLTAIKESVTELVKPADQ